MTLFDRRTASILLTILAFGTALAIIYLARTIMIIFAFSILFAYLIDPAVRFLQRHSLFFKDLRGPHVLATYVGFILLGVLVLHNFAPGLLLENPSHLVGAMSAEVEKISTGEIADDLVNELGWSEAQATPVRTFLKQHQANITGFVEETKRRAPTAITAMFVIPILAIFFLSD